MNSSFSTQTSNFGSGLNSSVDTRTGLYNMSLQMLSLTANNNLGPEVALSLVYNPLDPVNLGYGNGFSLGLSSYNVKTGLLNLSSGEKYRISETSNQPIVLQKKLNNFVFKKTSKAYQIIWKNGVIEELHGHELNSDIKFPVRIISPLGHEINFDWDYTGVVPRLKQLKDNVRTLLKIQYNGNLSTIIDIFPRSEENKSVNLSFANNNLNTLILSTQDSLSFKWSLDYQKVGNWYLINGMTYPTGLKEEAKYQDNIMRFPDNAKLAALPAVTNFRQYPGASQPILETTYNYSDNNYLGYGGNNDWDSKNDFAYGIAGNYEYASTETVVSSKKTIVTRRMYNRFHLLKEEKAQRDGATMTRTLSYYADEISPFDKQPPQFLLPKEVKEEVKNAEGGRRVRYTTTQFDEAGNLLEQIDPDGTVTSFIWYPPEGEKGYCPEEPNGFTRFLKQKTIQYPQNTYADVADNIEQYTYDTLGNTGAVVQSTQSILNGSNLLRKKVTTYCRLEGDAEFGRVIEIKETMYDCKDSQNEFTSSLKFTTEVEETYLKQRVEFTGHDGLTSLTERTSSLLTGLLQDETNAQGIKTAYEWDGSGRPLSRTGASDTQYANTTTWSYSIKGNPKTVQMDDAGKKITTHLDGMGRVITQELSDIDRDKKNYPVYSARYNELGESISESFQDWSTLSSETPVEYSQEHKTQFGVWGEAQIQTMSDGLSRQQTLDPVKLTQSVKMKGSQYAAVREAGIIKSIFDEKDLRLKQVEYRDAHDEKQGSVSYSWDGKGQLREFRDERGNSTQHTYDAYGRMVTQTLPDGTVVTRTYAPFLTGNQVTSIQVQGPKVNGNAPSWVVGTQTFDSLGRLKQRTSGGRTTQYQYEGAVPVPSSVMLPSGSTIEYTYIPELDNAVRSITVDGIEQTFGYDNTTGRVLQGAENGIKKRNVWSKGGHLKQEILTTGQSERQTEYTHLLSGSVASYTDITGQETRYKRDEYGRVISIEDMALTVDLEYDGLGRLSVQTVKDTADSANTLSTTLQYDDFNREVIRTVKDCDGQSVTVVQTWLESNLLNSRKTQQNGEMLKEEQYDYDNRNRLILYTVKGTVLPKEGYGYFFSEQKYQYDALNNLIRVITTLEDNTQDEAIYHYENKNDPTQLTSVTHTHTQYPPRIELHYDKEGRMILDEGGRELYYDALGRLKTVKGPDAGAGSYDYDAFNYLVRQTMDNTDSRELFYRGDELVNEVLTAQKREIRFIKAEHSCLAVADGKELILTASDKNDSLMWSHEGGDGKGKLHSWAPYGSGEGNDFLLGFNGERLDLVSGTYHLGNGYRAYNPILMRFNCPDSLSPFGVGGINPYAYCAGDPINFTDPSGHISWQGILGVILGVGGLVLAAVTAGASIAAMGGISAALSSASISSLVVGTVGVVADVTAIASSAVENSNPEASSILGWVSLAAGIVGIAAGAFAARNLPKSIKKIKTNFIERENDRFYRSIDDFDFSLGYRDYRNAGYEPRKAVGEALYDLGREHMRNEMFDEIRSLRGEIRTLRWQPVPRRGDFREPRRFVRQDSFSSSSNSSGFSENSRLSSRSASFNGSFSSLSSSPRSSVSSGSYHTTRSSSISGSEMSINSSLLRRMSDVSLSSTESDYSLFKTMFIESANPGSIFSN